MCAWSFLRMSAMARWAAMLITCASPKDVAAWISVAMPAAAASGYSSDTSCFPMTSSIRYFELAGRTKPAS